MEERSLKRRYAVKFCVPLGKNAVETFQTLQVAFKGDCVSGSQPGWWHEAFMAGDRPMNSVLDAQQLARIDENVNRVARSDRRLSHPPRRKSLIS